MTTASSRSRAYARFIPKEEIGVVAEWTFGAVDDAARQAAELAAANDDDAVQARLAQSWQEGHAAGLARGRADATAEAEQRMQQHMAGQGRETAQRLAALAAALAERLADNEERIARGVLEMACGLARQVVRQELAGNPNALLPVVREAVRMLLSDGSTAVVRLNPADMEVVEQPLAEEFGSQQVRWLADPAVEPGGCLVDSAGAVVDGALARRWSRAIANLGLDVPWQDAAPAEDGDAS